MTKMAIPVSNIYYLLCYAWDEFAPSQTIGVAAEDAPDTLHLFSRMLVVGLRALYRRGLETGYVTQDEAMSVIRGRIVIGDTIRLLATRPKKIACSFDEITPDILSNQILKTTMRTLLETDGLRSDLRAEVRQSLPLLSGVREIELNARVFHNLRLHQNNRLYAFLMNVCHFFFESLEPLDQQGRFRFRGVEKDERRMRRVFEKFVRNFFARAQSIFKVKQDRVEWAATALEGSDLNLLPRMMTDATLRSSDRTIVIECKYTESLFQGRFFADKLRSAHLYQLCAYLRNFEDSSGLDNRADGILLYPTAGTALDQSYRLHGHRVRIKTLDLNQPWRKIEEAMLALLQPITS
jgi:5-methylcytosine-specific restriction enzyme subunit McrC